jgi:hypothetical protein
MLSHRFVTADAVCQGGVDLSSGLARVVVLASELPLASWIFLTCENTSHAGYSFFIPCLVLFRCLG